MSTIHDELQRAIRALAGADARAEAELLLAHVLARPRAWLVAHANDAPTPVEATAFRDLVVRRTRGEPVAYLTGWRGFHAIDLRVTPDVLIPRAETELLVELALARIPPEGSGAVADLGTGSGAVALAIAQARPQASVLATDASAAALAVATDNAARLGLRNVAFTQGDWCAALGDARFDLVVSNPPYVAAGDPHLMQGDLRSEPAMALVSGADGLDAIRAILHDARAHLRSGGWLLLEHGFDQGTVVRGLLRAHGFAEVSTARDLGGRERVSGGSA